MDKYIEYLAGLPGDVLHVARAFAMENSSPSIEPAHILRAMLNKSAGLVDFIENDLDSDYYYLLDWADLRVGQAQRSAYPMKEDKLSAEARSVVKEARRLGDSRGIAGSDMRCLLAALVSPGVGFSADQLKTLPLTATQILEGTGSPVAMAVAGDEVAPAASSKGSKADSYCENLSDNVSDLPVLGMDGQIRSMAETLSRRDKANVMIVGDSGVGKTSLLQGFMQAIRDGKAPRAVSGMSLIELDLIALTQGVGYKGEVEDRFKKVVASLAAYERPVLVIENFQRIEDRQSILAGLLPAIKRDLSRGELQLICTTTTDGFTKDIERDKELMAYFEKITVEAPSDEDARLIVESKLEGYSAFHNVSVEDGLADVLVRLAKRYMPERSLPSSAIDLLDRAMASARIEAEMDAENADADAVKLRNDYVKDVVSRMTGIPMGNIQDEERGRLAGAEETLHRRVVGQNHAVKSVLDAVYESRSGLNKKGQPMGSFFFLGPTGTGKTELAKALAQFLFNDETSILRFDMSEYKEEHSVALLYGAPPGYVGYEEGGLLVNKIRQHPYSVVLFDEIEKAHKSVFDLFLQILDEGKLHDRLGRVGDFSNALIIFTSNIGSDYIFKAFEAGDIPTHDRMLDIMQGHFRPEFLARLTEIIPFSPITTEMIDKIFDIHIKGLLKMLSEQDITLNIDETARGYVTRVGFNTHYGARPVLGIIRKEIRRPLSKMIIRGDVAQGDIVTMKYDDERKEIVWEIDSKD